jgi:Flp pilus assembly protein TadG
MTLRRWAGRFSRDERGSAFLVVGAFLVLLLFVGMATDFGILMRYRRAMQNGCDSAVLAGAQDLKSATRSATTTAQTYAQRDLTENNIIWIANNFSATTEDANGQADGTTNAVRLAATYHATVPLFFLASVSPSVTVSVQCAAQRVPVLTTGLRPVGLDSAVFTARWQAQGNAACPIFGASGNPNPNAVGSLPCGDCVMTFINGGSASQFQCDAGAPGSGNTGALDLQNAPVCGTSNGASNWECVMENGTGTNPAYCATTSTSTNSSNWPACATVNPKTGNFSGPWKTAVKAVCQTPNPVDNPRASEWVVVMPLINSTIWEGGISGNKPVPITGFAAFELDCGYMNAQNSYDPIYGTFVKLLDLQGVTGNPGGADTGVETIILVQ